MEFYGCAKDGFCLKMDGGTGLATGRMGRRAKRRAAGYAFDYSLYAINIHIERGLLGASTEGGADEWKNCKKKGE